MGVGGCMYTQQTQNKATGVLNGRAGPIWDKHVRGRNGHNHDVVRHDRHRKFEGNGGDDEGDSVLSMHS